MSASQVEAVSRLDVALDQLLTAYLMCGGNEILTPDQRAAISTLLDTFDAPTMNAIRYAVGMHVVAAPTSEGKGSYV